MSEAEFVVAVKSTIDKIGKDLATSLGIAHYVDLDDTVNVSGILTGNDTAVVCRFLSIDEAPLDPMYRAMFMVGIKTTNDAANYILLDFMSKVKQTFRIGTDLSVMNWSTAIAPTQRLGSLLITESGVDDQVMDRESGVRFLVLSAAVVRFR